MDTLIIAHRGASALAAHENTLEAFDIAISLGCEYAEFDIRSTKDKELIVFHNEDIHGKMINDLTYAELCDITKSDEYRVPLLQEVLFQCAGRIKLDIELKEVGYENRVIAMVKKLFSNEEFQIKSFWDTAVARTKCYDASIRAGLLLGLKDAGTQRRFNEYFPARRISACGADFISPHYKLVTKDFIKRMQKIGMDLYVWTVNNEAMIERLLSVPVRGIITDMPDKALEIRSELCGSETIENE